MCTKKPKGRVQAKPREDRFMVIQKNDIGAMDLLKNFHA